MFEINRENILSMGGNAMVFEGVWDGNPVAIKRMELFKTKYDQRMVEALKELNHPNIVKLFHDQSDENFRFTFTSWLKIIYRSITYLSKHNYKLLLLNML
jgi:hypothetical protein